MLEWNPYAIQKWKLASFINNTVEVYKLHKPQSVGLS